MDQATRDNKNKLDYTILPWEVVGEVVKVFEFGASKYTRDNYQKGDGLPLANYHQSAMRHLVASINGEENDKECSEFHKMPVDHMAHVAANALMYLWQKQHEAKKPEMVEMKCWRCDFPFILPKQGFINCPSCSIEIEVVPRHSPKKTPTPFGESLKLLRELADMQNDAPLERYRKEWESVMKEVYGFLEKWEEPVDLYATKVVTELCNTCLGVTSKLVDVNCKSIECSHCQRVLHI